MKTAYLDINDVRCYEHNPRTLKNPKIDEIKSSIDANGLLAPFAVTKRPREKHYILYMGANSRLSIIKDKFESGTSEERKKYKKILCNIFPWKSELDVMLKHGIENEARGSMSFIEEARFIRTLQTKIEEEYGKEVKAPELSEHLTNLGYSINRNKITLSQFACDFLEDAAPKALATGMNRNHVAKLRKLWKKFETVADKYKIRSDKEGFQSVLKKNDDRFEYFKRIDLLKELSAHLGKKTGVQMQNMELEIHLVKVEDETKVHVGEGFQRKLDAYQNRASSSSSTPIDEGEAPTAPDQQQEAAMHNESDLIDVSVDEEKAEICPEVKPLNITDHQALRQQAYELARIVAKCFNMESTVIQIDTHMGFIIENPCFDNVLDDQALSMCSSVWWLLVGLSEQFTLNKEQIETLKPSIASTKIVSILDQSDIDDRYDSLFEVVRLNVNHLYGATMDHIIKAAHFSTLNKLTETCCEIKGMGHDG